MMSCKTQIALGRQRYQPVTRTVLVYWVLQVSCLRYWGLPMIPRKSFCFPLAVRSRADENRIAALERKVGQRTVEIDFCGDACCTSESSGGCRH